MTVPGRLFSIPAISAARGFTLIEMLIVVVIVGILAAVAYPTYQDQLVRTRRTEMQADLMRLAQRLERIHTETGCYNPGSDNDCNAGTGAAPDVDTVSRYYGVELVGDVERDRFRLRAVPLRDGPQAEDGILEIDHLGVRYWDENGDGDTADPGETDWEPG